MASMQRFLLAVAIVAAAAFSTASCASYTVGEPGGSWDLQTNYTAWASSISFSLGDQLVFKYSPAAHDVVEVTKDGYLSCSASKPIAALRTGQDTVKLDSIWPRYFICSVPGHCDAGMKLQVKVAPAGCGSPAAGPVDAYGNGAPGMNGTPGGICVGDSPNGSPTTIITGSNSYNSASGPSRGASSALVSMAATTLLLVLMV